MAGDFPVLLSERNARNLRIFTDDGKAVALVGMLVRDVWLGGSRHRAATVGSVCTHADYRGQGLATRLMEDALATARRDGVDLFLISGSRGLYLRLGYLKVSGYRAYTIGRDQLPARGPYTLSPWQPEDLPALVALHRAEPVRFVRPPEDFLAILESGNVSEGPGNTMLVRARKGGEPLAYFCYKTGGRHNEPDALTVVEMAGSRAAAVHGFRMLLDERGARGLELHVPACDTEAIEQGRLRKWPFEPRAFRGTVGIVDPERFWEACRPAFAEQLGAKRAARLSVSTQDGIVIRYGDETLRLAGMGELTGLAFQPRDLRGELALEADCELRAVLDELFPLPLMDYGLDYV